MRITEATYRSLAEHRMMEFLKKGRVWLVNRFGKVITDRKLPASAIDELIRQSYQWTETQKVPDQLLAIHIASARLCLGSFFMEDVRYTELQKIVEHYISAKTSPQDETIPAYLIAHKDDWSVDWLSEHYKHSWGPDTPHCIIPQYHNAWLGSGQIFTRLYTVEKRTAFSPTVELYENIYRQLMASARRALSRYESGGQAEVLLAVAQYYDGFRCFDDPLHPRWYGCLNLGQQEYAYWRLLDIFTKTAQENRR
ncbi:hypothetical protein WKP56_000108 [Escherichia coli]|uniref:Uncharacterized protein n=2 Tax=Enterobacteriaceae TaxID=543 RepID=A0A0L7ANB1_ECOLX|nr:hypothetical protein ERJG_00864 [Escherichia coli M863]EGE63728.1 hypothetical protein ECSTEC7V_2903 [Escherichia coli STEC_7v]EGO6586742.1 hypothetical protein [Escherichia coli]EHQ5576194.1 hypothetical protein [Escherichia coli O2]EIG82456.1 hypothetical protein EC12741_1325 [Escherichia coli 1.2741]BDI37258.1 hypothetical protein EsCdI10290_03099 [Escherichia sp. 10290]BDI47023.1 hypothetical protein EsCd1HHP049_02897 [Escherichia sp. HH154_1D]